MTLLVINKYTHNKNEGKPTIFVKSSLSAQEQTLLVDYFILEGVLTHDEKKQVVKLCQAIHERDCWVQCDCITGEEKPVFRFNRAVSGKLYLHHITSRKSHAPECVFKEVHYSKSTHPGSNNKPNIKKLTPLNLLPKKAFDLLPKSAPKSNSERSPSVKRQHSLGYALNRLLDEAGVNVICPTKTLMPFKAIEEAASRIEFLSKKMLSGYLYLNPKMVVRAAYALRDDKSAWPEERSRHCLFLIKARKFDATTIDSILPDGSIQQITISNRIYCSSGRLGERSGPFLALILITNSVDKPSFYEPVKAFIQPCYSEKSFIPVDSYYEREVLRRLFAIQFEYSKQNKTLKIIKPLFDIPVHQGRPEETFVLPDFIIHSPSKKLIIEVNGSHEEDYVARKKRMHDSMEALGPVFSIDAVGAEKNNQLNLSISVEN